MEGESFYILGYKLYVYYLCQWLEETVPPAQVVEGHTTMCASALSALSGIKKNHHCQLQLVTTTTCAQGISATRGVRCKGLE